MKIGRFLLFCGILTVLCASCAPITCRDTTLYQRSGRQKAIVAVLPVLNHSGVELPWNVSREFTDEIRKRIYDSAKIYLLRDHGSFELAERLNAPNPTQIPLEELHNLGAAEFVVVTELVDQKEKPHMLKNAREDQPSRGEIGSIITLSMRVRVIDVRHDKPKVILQEVLSHENLISRAHLYNNYSKTPWGTEAFHRTPLGMAHDKLVREVVSRVESYVEATR